MPYLGIVQMEINGEKGKIFHIKKNFFSFEKHFATLDNFIKDKPILLTSKYLYFLILYFFEHNIIGR